MNECDQTIFIHWNEKKSSSILSPKKKKKFSQYKIYKYMAKPKWNLSCQKFQIPN